MVAEDAEGAIVGTAIEIDALRSRDLRRYDLVVPVLVALHQLWRYRNDVSLHSRPVEKPIPRRSRVEVCKQT